MFCDVCSWVPLSLTVKLHLLCIWTLSSSDIVKLWISKSYRGQLKDSNTNNIKGSNIHWCPRRKHDALRTEDVHIHTMCVYVYIYINTHNFFLYLQCIEFPPGVNVWTYLCLSASIVLSVKIWISKSYSQNWKIWGIFWVTFAGLWGDFSEGHWAV